MLSGLQFWRVLSGCVSSGGSDGRRVDLLSCRVVEAPREGAALLKALWELTAVPFAAADNALGGGMVGKQGVWIGDDRALYLMEIINPPSI